MEYRNIITEKYTNDIGKYLVMDNLYTKELITINARSLLNMFWLRTDPKALKEFRDIMKYIYKVLPECHKFIYKQYDFN
jgi:thymidylate synthase ThyX